MNSTTPLTTIFDNATENAFKITRPGMASFAGTGPDNQTCKQCDFHHRRETRTPHNLGQGKCLKYALLMGVEGPQFPNTSRACRHFVEKIYPPVAELEGGEA